VLASLSAPVVAAVVALLSACGFAVSTSLQHRVAGTAPESMTSGVRILLYVVRRPLWLLGSATGAAALCLHALALKLGAIALVQPLMLAGVVLAVLVRAGLDRRLPVRAELSAVLLTTVALAVFLAVANPRPSATPPDHGVAGLLVVAGFLVAAMVTAIGKRVASADVAALLLGVAAGTLFGLTAGLMKLIGSGVDGQHLSRVFGWPLLAMVVAGVAATAINQRAYQIAVLAKSMPVLNVVDVLVAVLFGLVVFGERPAHGLPALVVQAVAMVFLAIGLRWLALLEAPLEAAREDTDARQPVP
jgi:hypothetical protein